jgi:hypothetical protein
VPVGGNCFHGLTAKRGPNLEAGRIASVIRIAAQGNANSRNRRLFPVEINQDL